MADIGTHVLCGACASVAAIELGLADLPNAVESSWLFFGMGAADLSILLLKKTPSRVHKKPASFWDQNEWEDQHFEEQERTSWWAMPYIVVHSMIWSTLILGLVWTWSGSDLVLWFAAGHFTHILIDDPTHKRSHFFHPFKFRLYKGRNWWEYKLFRSVFWRVQQWVVGLSTIAVHAIWNIL